MDGNSDSPSQEPTPPVPPRRRGPVEALTLETEKLLWDRNVLNLIDSLGLSRAVYFYFLKAFGVYSRNATRDLRSEQFWLGEDDIGKYVGFIDNANSVNRPRELTRSIQHYEDPANPYSVYKIMSLYMTFIPAKGEFFRRPIWPTTNYQKTIQFSNSPIGINTLSHYLTDMIKDAGLYDYFTPQSIKSYVFAILFRAGIDEELTRERTRSWILPNRIADRPQNQPADRSTTRTQMQRYQILAISKLLDPPSLTSSSPPQHAAPFCIQSGSDDDVTLVVQPEMAPSTSQYVPKKARSSRRLRQPPNVVEYHTEYSVSGESSANSESEEAYTKRPRLDAINNAPVYSTVPIHITKSQVVIKDEEVEPDESDCCVLDDGDHPEFVALSGPMLDSTPVPIAPRQLTLRKEVLDRSLFVKSEQQTNNITSSNQATTSSTSSPAKNLQKNAGVKNQMQCLTNGEMKEASSRPPTEGTSSVSLAFKFAYEIDHNGEVAASREVRAMHATNNDESPTSSVKRRLLPMNVVDSSGQDAAERQVELPNFVLKLSDFFPSISRQPVDIMDVVIRGTRGQGIDRLNVELVVAERGDPIPEYSVID